MTPPEPTSRTWRLGHLDHEGDHSETIIRATHATLTKPEGTTGHALMIHDREQLVALLAPGSWGYLIDTKAPIL